MGVSSSFLSLASFVNELGALLAWWRFRNLNDVVYKKADANDRKEKREAGDEHEELVEQVHALRVVLQVLGLVGPLLSLLSNLSLSC